MGPGLVVHPVEASLNSQRSQKAVLAPVPVACRQVDRPPLVVEAVPSVVGLLVPSLGHANTNAWPLVHHRDGQSVKLLLAALGKNEVRFWSRKLWPLLRKRVLTKSGRGKTAPSLLLFKERAVNG